MKSLIEELRPFLQPGMTVLDVGAGDLRHSKKLSELGLKVTAIDVATPKTAIPIGVKFFQTNAMEYSGSADVIFAANVVHLFNKQMFHKFLLKHEKASLLAIRAFSKQPTPAFQNEITTYTITDFEKIERPVYLLDSWSEEMTGLDGQTRTWHIIDYIGGPIKNNPKED